MCQEVRVMGTRRPIREVRDDFVKHAGVPVVDAGQAGELLGVSRRRVNAMALDDRTFPHSYTVIGGERLWYRAGIELWAAAHRPERAAAHGVYGPDAAAVLRLAEDTAHEFCHAGVGDDHLWVALVDSAAPGIVRDVLGSLGVDREELLVPLLRAWPPGDGDGYAPRETMSPAVQAQLAKAADHLPTFGATRAGAEAIALALLDDWPKPTRDPFRRGGCTVTFWLARRGLDPEVVRERVVRAATDRRELASFDVRRLPKRRPNARRRPRPGVTVLAPNPLGHDPRERHPWGSIFARRTNGKAWIEAGRQYFFFYDRDRFRVMTTDDAPVGYWWQVDPPPTARRAPKGSRREAVLPKPGDDIEWPERLSNDPRGGLLAHHRAK
jgi:hypothetical protein